MEEKQKIKDKINELIKPYSPDVDASRVTIVHETPKVKIASQEIAYDIYYHFAVHQSTSIRGFEAVEMQDGEIDDSQCVGTGTFTLGELVIKELEKLDIQENFEKDMLGKFTRRKRSIPKNCIGGYTAQKQFRIEKETRNGIPVYTIWRMQ